MKSRKYPRLVVIMATICALLLCCLLATIAAAAERFNKDAQGVITDSQTGLQWVVGPDQPISHYSAEAWVKKCGIAGGGWRMPTKDELLGLYIKGQGENNIPAVFSLSKGFQGLLIWAKAKDKDFAWYVDFSDGTADAEGRSLGHGPKGFEVKVLGVRKPKSAPVSGSR